MTDRKMIMYVQLEERYESLRVEARIGLWDASEGTIRNVSYRDRFGDGDEPKAARFEGFHVGAYVGPGTSYPGSTVLDSERDIWGPSYGYQDVFAIDTADHASAIAGVLRKLAKGFDKLNAERGYAAPNDFAQLVLRTAHILGVKKIMVRSHPKQFEVSGERWKTVDGIGLGYWVDTITQAAAKGEERSLIGR